MSEGELLLRALLVDPADDAPRLIYADWLDEQGQTSRAQFIRTSIRLHSAEADCDELTEILQLDLEKLRDISWSGLTRTWHEGRLTISSWDRGFVGGIRCPLKTFLSRAKSLLGSQPIVSVNLLDRDPQMWAGFWGWHESGPHLGNADSPDTIPSHLMHPFLNRYQHDRAIRNGAFFLTPELAIAALSDACVDYGRTLAGLPILAIRA